MNGNGNGKSYPTLEQSLSDVVGQSVLGQPLTIVGPLLMPVLGTIGIIALELVGELTGRNPDPVVIGTLTTIALGAIVGAAATRMSHIQYVQGPVAKTVAERAAPASGNGSGYNTALTLAPPANSVPPPMAPSASESLAPVPPGGA